MIENYRQIAILLAASGVAVFAAGCTEGMRGTVTPEKTELAGYMRLMLPADITIQTFTQPISTRGDGAADAIEAILAASDVAGDPVKVVGVFQFELYERRPASAIQLGERLAYWRLPIESAAMYSEYWDPYARYYRFPLDIDNLSAGQYLLRAQFTNPFGEHLFDEYAFEFDGSAVPPLQPRY